MSVVEQNRRINPDVLQALREGRIVVGERGSGKTITLLTYLAVTQPQGKRGGGPIVVSEDFRSAKGHEWFWRRCFADHPMPRFLSYRQIEKADGLNGIVFVDEPREWLNYVLRARFYAIGGFGGGVGSSAVFAESGR